MHMGLGLIVTKMSNIQAIRGMNDILPEESIRWIRFESIVMDWLHSYGYQNIRTPILEKTELFVRSIGEVTDIVEKEMYTFIDSLSQDSLALRPEGTASCVRAVLEHHLLRQAPQRLYYMGPMFRHERPQKGRYRQFHQVGVEAIGFAGPDIDVEHLLMVSRLWRLLGLEGIRLEINSLGSSDERIEYRKKLIAYFEENLSVLDEEAQRRLYTNPLRILDSKNSQMQEMINRAPRLIDVLGKESQSHFSLMCENLEACQVPYAVNPRLVRGLDYYNLTVFEWVTDQLGSQGTVCAGGRYDALLAQIGGQSSPACGFALGIERILSLLSRDFGGKLEPDVYFVNVGTSAQFHANIMAEKVRDAGFSVILHAGEGAMKTQMKKANASGAAFALILGEEEVERELVGVKALRLDVAQQTLPLDAALAWMSACPRSGDKLSGDE